MNMSHADDSFFQFDKAFGAKHDAARRPISPLIRTGRSIPMAMPSVSQLNLVVRPVGPRMRRIRNRAMARTILLGLLTGKLAFLV